METIRRGRFNAVFSHSFLMCIVFACLTATAADKPRIFVLTDIEVGRANPCRCQTGAAL
jgi:hypothetical protein